MLVKFKSRGDAELLMDRGLANQLLGLVGKSLGEPGVPGVIHRSEVPQALARLESAVAIDKAEVLAQSKAEKDLDKREWDEELHLAQRAFPLLHMLREAQKHDVDVFWNADF